MVVYLAFLPTLGPFEIAVILVVGLLLFGSRLPEVGRSLGKGLIELKKSMRGIKDEMWSLEREADAQVDAELARRKPISGVPASAYRSGPGPDPIDAELAGREEDWRGEEDELASAEEIDPQEVDDLISSECEDDDDSELHEGELPESEVAENDQHDGEERQADQKAKS